MLLYLHGFASGPASTKGVAVERHLAPRGIEVRRMDLRLPSFEHLRLSAMVAAVRAALTPGCTLMGSSLGGLTAALAADERVARLVLLAPAFQLAARWRARDPAAVARWAREGWLEVTDYTTGRPAKVDHGFLLDVEATERPFVPRVPTLIVHGRHDETVGIETSRALAGHPLVRLVEVDDGHELVASLPVVLAETERHLGVG